MNAVLCDVEWAGMIGRLLSLCVVYVVVDAICVLCVVSFRQGGCVVTSRSCLVCLPDGG